MIASAAAQLLAARAYGVRALAIRAGLQSATVGIFDALGDYSAVAPFVDQAVPLSVAAQRGLVSLLGGYLSTVTGERTALDAVASWVGDAARPDDMRDSWSVPFYSMWKALGEGAEFDQAAELARASIESNAATDLAFAQGHAMADLSEAVEGVVGYRRVLAGVGCDFCATAATQRYHTGDLMPIHPNCQCSVAPIIGTSDPGRVINAEVLDEGG
jgi:hypothetical protein